MGSLTSELSTPLVNLRALLVVHKLEGTLAFKLNDIVTAILFFVFRILLYPYLGWRMVYAFNLLSEVSLTPLLK
jgi:TLC domain